MKCQVYRSARRAETYVYVAEASALERLPAALREGLGALSLALEFELTPTRKLARSEASTVLANIAAIGYHLQVPPPAGMADD
jgi:uncharacterized protein YcgL (UPF0745 family)